MDSRPESVLSRNGVAKCYVSPSLEAALTARGESSKKFFDKLHKATTGHAEDMQSVNAAQARRLNDEVVQLRTQRVNEQRARAHAEQAQAQLMARLAVAEQQLSERSAAVSVQQPIAAPELSTAGCMQVDRNECRPPPEEPVQLDAATAFYYTSFVQS